VADADISFRDHHQKSLKNVAANKAKLVRGPTVLRSVEHCSIVIARGGNAAGLNPHMPHALRRVNRSSRVGARVLGTFKGTGNRMF
jgi:hypothetical protein